MSRTLTPEVLLRAYTCGVFPMARARDDHRLYWIDPQDRGILPLDRFHVPRSLVRTLARGRYRVTVNRAFAGVMEGCAASTEGRPETWINEEILSLFCQLHKMGLAHSVEVWDGSGADAPLVGGLYGLALGGAFFGESMFTRRTDASKVALCHLVVRLRKGGFTLLDTQFVNDHLRRFGAEEIPKAAYLGLLSEALRHHADFQRSVSPEEVLAFARQARSQTS